jgi:hypothetical protein
MRTLRAITILALGLAACATNMPSDPGSTDPGGDDDTGSNPPPPPPPPPGTSITGTWTGTFTTDNALASAGNFSFDFTEDASTHAVTGPFTGTVTAGASGTAFEGTFTGTHTDDKLMGTVAVTQPTGVTGNFNFDDATIANSTIMGAFDIDVSYSGIAVQGTGSYSISKM